MINEVEIVIIQNMDYGENDRLLGGWTIGFAFLNWLFMSFNGYCWLLACHNSDLYGNNI